MEDLRELAEEIKITVDAFNKMRIRYNLLHKEWVKSIYEEDFRLAKAIRRDLDKVDVIYNNYHLELLKYKAYLNKVNTSEKYIVITGAGYFQV